jgi:capsular exopolysaccharide synthesis family protein
MDSVNYLRAIARHWKIITACVLVALVVGVVLTGGDDRGDGQSRPNTLFEATTYLLPTTAAGGTIRGGETGLATTASLVTLGPVPRNAAEALGEDDAVALANQISAEPDPEGTGMLLISATDAREQRAILLANTFAAELLEYLAAQTTEDYEQIQEQVDELQRQINQAQRREAEATTEAARTEAAERVSSLESQQSYYELQLGQLAFQVGNDPSGFEVIEEATARQIATSDGFEAPQSRAVRLGIAAAIGLILGIALALVLERFDTKIRSKDAAEASFKLPVLAEIPAISRRRRRKGSVVTDAFPSSHETNAFRLLAAALQFGRHEGTLRTSSSNGSRSPRSFVVTSPSPAEGKSTIVANLAATFADIGKRVVVLCCDFRHPTLHQTFAIEQGPGLAEALDGDGEVELEPLLQPTAIERIHVIATGTSQGKAAALFGSPRMAQVLEKARAHADIVLIDTAPVLVASDWTQLLPEVDAVLVVARAGRTDTSSAERTAEILEILQAPVVGVALNRLPRSVIRQSGYKYRYFDRYRAERESRAVEPIGEFSLNGDIDLLAEEPELAPAGVEVEAAASDERPAGSEGPVRSRRSLRRERARARAANGEEAAETATEDAPERVEDAPERVEDASETSTNDPVSDDHAADPDGDEDMSGGIPHLVRPSTTE